jgi:VWFA-related protein
LAVKSSETSDLPFDSEAKLMKNMKERFPDVPAFMVFMSLMVSGFTSFVLIAGAQQKPPTFRSGVDLRQLDITVLDRDRRPVRGLSASDFRIEEDGTPQPIEAFSFVDLQTAVATDAVWSNRTVSDVVTNDIGGSRAFTLVIDDSGIGDLWAKREMPKSVATFVDQLQPEDIAAVVFVRRSGASQNFTRDKAKLIQSVNRYAGHPGGGGECATAETMLYVSQSLATLKNRRKAIVYFGGALSFVPLSAFKCGPEWLQMVQVANANNITVYTVDTMGLRPRTQVRADQYLSLAHYTGGRALVNSNSFDEGLSKIFAENTSYYLLAYQPTNTADDGRFRRVVVRVNRPDVEVVSTRSYWAPRAPTARRPAVPPPAPDLEALAGALPLSQIPMRATAAAFRADETGAAVVTVALGLEPPAFLARTRETVDVLLRAFSPDGIDYGSERQSISVTVPAAREGEATSRYEVVARINVPKPGRYELRVSTHSAATDLRGGIFVDVDVPDFRKDLITLSGVVLASPLATTPAGSLRAVRDITPLAPTTERAFRAGDPVTALVRLYQGGHDQVAPVTMSVGILDAAGQSAFARSETIAADRFTEDRASDYQLRLPLTTLKAGDYLLTFEATVRKTTASRSVRFLVR